MISSRCPIKGIKSGMISTGRKKYPRAAAKRILDILGILVSALNAFASSICLLILLFILKKIADAIMLLLKKNHYKNLAITEDLTSRLKTYVFWINRE